MATTIVKPAAASEIQGAFRAFATTTTSGSFKAGFFVAGFLNTGGSAVTVDGQSLPAGGSRTYPFVNKQYMEDCAYDATGSTLEITVIW